MIESAKPNQAGIAVKWAIINVITAIVVTYIFQLLGTDVSAPVRYLAYIPFIAFVCLAQIEYRDKASGFMTYGQGFVEGLLFGVFSGIMLAIFMYLYYAVLYPQGVDQMVAAAHDKMVAQGQSSDAIDTATEMTKKYGAIFASVGGLFGTPIAAIIVSLITAAIFKKEPTIADIESRQNDTTV
jgi:hypothetical protein